MFNSEIEFMFYFKIYTSDGGQKTRQKNREGNVFKRF